MGFHTVETSVVETSVTERPVISVGWQDTSQRIPVGDLCEIGLNRQAFRVVPVDHEHPRVRCGIVIRAVGILRPDEGHVPEYGVIIDGEVVGRGDGDGVPECAREVIVQDCAGVANVLGVSVAKPSSRSNRKTYPVKEIRLAAEEEDRDPSVTDLIMAPLMARPLVLAEGSSPYSRLANPPIILLSRTTVLI